jgi:DNA-binding NarL/FixJ family response regulator
MVQNQTDRPGDRTRERADTAGLASRCATRALTRRQRIVAHYVAMGHSNKLIAYQLGRADSTISTTVTRIKQKLRVDTRAGIARAVTELSAAPETWIDTMSARLGYGPRRSLSSEQLTAAERAVARGAAQGQSNREIARARAASERTIANQLASVFAKLGVHSRVALVGLCFDGGGSP